MFLNGFDRKDAIFIIVALVLLVSLHKLVFRANSSPVLNTWHFVLFVAFLSKNKKKIKTRLHVSVMISNGH